MRSTSIAALLTIFLIALAHSQAAPRKHDAAISSGAVRVKALQNQVEKQQIEIDALRLRLGKLQQEFQELTEMIADQDADSSYSQPGTATKAERHAHGASKNCCLDLLEAVYRPRLPRASRNQ